ncbi:MAG: prepilin-type N-terminal cleavage/methylation domain-containing protein [Patescibacteria group bacterium]
MFNYKINIFTSKRVPGFTLMEIVIVLALFALASVLIAGIFVNMQTTQRRVRDNQELITDARYLLEVIAREVRSDFIDYTGQPLPVNTDVLSLKSPSGTPVVLAHSDAVTCGTVYKCATISRDGGTVSSITSKNLAVEHLQFYVSPLTDPFPTNVLSTTEDKQPRVTIVLKASNAPKNPRPSETKAFYLQTTVSARAYVR